jgi:hypothetical protein
VKICSIEGCTRVVKARGWCQAHYLSWNRYGDPLAAKPRPTVKVCTVADCDSAVYGRGYCRRHYDSFKTYGDPLKARQNYPKTDVCRVPDCGEKPVGRGYCNKHWKRWSLHGDPLTVLPKGSGPVDMAGRLARNTEQQGDCLVWIGSCTPAGYAKTMIKKRTVLLHRWVWEQANGPIPAGMKIDHICHRPPCLHLGHLRLTTNKQNLENRKGAPANSTTGVRGVSIDKKTGAYRGYVKHHGRTICVGRFETLDEAGEAVRLKRLELHTHNDQDRTQG